ncbi:MAG: hypothetical protein KKB30_14850 [Proteobacteria bacterium]|nr:hypothetical protein [Pseudomonadota bacterium]MBU1715723.1 hypothetical protein [Pseudomonadota bacterium]
MKTKLEKVMNDHQSTATTATKVKTRKQTRFFATVNNGNEFVSKYSVSLIGVVAVLIGLWSISCLLGAASGKGPLALLTNWFSAVMGM